MFTTKMVGNILRILILLGCLWALLEARNANAATAQTCPLGRICIEQNATNVGASSGHKMTFRIEIRNNLNFAASGLVLRYAVAKPVFIRSVKPSARYRQDVLVWRIPKLEPGDTWIATVKVEILTYARTTLANTATVVHKGETWLKSRIRYGVNSPVIVEEG